MLLMFKNELKRQRILAGYSQKELGNMLGLSQVIVSGYESGTRYPSIPVFCNICLALKVNPNDLLKDEMGINA